MLARPATPSAGLRRGSFGRKPSRDEPVNGGDYYFARATVAEALKFTRRYQFIATRVAAREQLPGDFRFDNEWSEFADPGAIDRHFRAPRSASNVGLRQQTTCRYLSFVAICRDLILRQIPTGPRCAPCAPCRGRRRRRTPSRPFLALRSNWSQSAAPLQYRASFLF
jgi:hypothetical protein